MPQGHPRCPDCHGAGGKQVRRVGKSPRWVRCKCVPSGRIDDSTKAQALNRITEVFIHNDGDPTRVTLALDILTFFQVSLDDVKQHLRKALPYDIYQDRDVEGILLTYKEDKDNANT